MKIIAIIFVLALCASCSESDSRSEEEIIADFQIEVELANDCEDSSECIVVYPECPLAICGIAINSSKIDELKGIEDKLYAEIENISSQCDILPGCLEATAECRDNKCEQVFVGEN